MELDEANRIRDEVKARLAKRETVLILSLKKFAEEFGAADAADNEKLQAHWLDEMLRVVGKEVCWAWMGALDFPGVFPRFEDEEGSPDGSQSSK